MKMKEKLCYEIDGGLFPEKHQAVKHARLCMLEQLFRECKLAHPRFAAEVTFERIGKIKTIMMMEIECEKLEADRQ